MPAQAFASCRLGSSEPGIVCECRSPSRCRVRIARVVNRRRRLPGIAQIDLAAGAGSFDRAGGESHLCPVAVGSGRYWPNSQPAASTSWPASRWARLIPARLEPGHAADALEPSSRHPQVPPLDRAEALRVQTNNGGLRRHDSRASDHRLVVCRIEEGRGGDEVGHAPLSRRPAAGATAALPRPPPGPVMACTGLSRGRWSLVEEPAPGRPAPPRAGLRERAVVCLRVARDLIAERDRELRGDHRHFGSLLSHY